MKNIKYLTLTVLVGFLSLSAMGADADDHSLKEMGYSSIPSNIPPLPEQCIADIYGTVDNYVSYFSTYLDTSRNVSKSPLLRLNPSIPSVTPASGSSTNTYLYDPQAVWINIKHSLVPTLSTNQLMAPPNLDTNMIGIITRQAGLGKVYPPKTDSFSLSERMRDIDQQLEEDPNTDISAEIDAYLVGKQVNPITGTTNAYTVYTLWVEGLPTDDSLRDMKLLGE